MTQYEALGFRGECYLSCFPRRRMPRLLRPLLLLLPKRRLVNQEISPLRRIDHRCTRTGITGEHHQPPRTVRPHNAFRSDFPTVRQFDDLALAELAPQRTLRDADGARLVHVEPAAPLVLA